MRAKAVIVVSLVLNGALALALWQTSRAARGRPAPRGPAFLPPLSNATVRVAKTNVILNSRVFTWENIESPDYDLFVLNLRGIGCPESTVRDIIVADVNDLYTRKRRELNRNTNDLKWWRSEADPEEAQAALDRERALDDERRRLLTRLLGTNWERTEEPEEAPLVLAGPVLGSLSETQKQKVQEIVSRSRLGLEAYLRLCEGAGETPDPAELARLREQTRKELAEHLNAEQLDEFLLRYSNTAVQLRAELQGFNTSPEEFRKLFAATDPIDRELAMLGTGDDPATRARRRQLEQARDAGLRAALSPERYDDYRMLTDGDYRAALVEARQAGASAQAGRGLYELNQAAARQREAIGDDPNLTSEQKERELKWIEQQQKVARAALLGQTLPEETKPAAAPAQNIFNHRSTPGETLAGLAMYYRVPIADLLRANPGMDPGIIEPGRTIKIPDPPPLPWGSSFVPQR